MDSNFKFRARSAIATCRILARPFDAGAPGQSLHYLIMQSLLAASESAQVVAQGSPSHCLRNAESRQRRAEMSTCVIIQSANWRQRVLCGGVDAGAADVAPSLSTRPHVFIIASGEGPLSAPITVSGLL